MTKVDDKLAIHNVSSTHVNDSARGCRKLAANFDTGLDIPNRTACGSVTKGDDDFEVKAAETVR